MNAFGLIHSRATSFIPFLILGALLSACAAAPVALPAADADIPVPGTAEARRSPELPPIPPVDGPLVLDVGYPPEGSTIAARDSNFIFGSTGSGRARLTINGHAVEVAPNGGFLAFIPVPPDGTYSLSAARNGETATLERHVTVPAPPATVGFEITSAYPSGALAVQRGETIEIGFRAPRGVRAVAVLPDGSRVQLVEQGMAAEVVAGDQFRTNLSAQPREPELARYSALIRVTTPIIADDTSVARPQIGSLVVPVDAMPDDPDDVVEPSVTRRPPLGTPPGGVRPPPARAEVRRQPADGVARPILLEIIAGADTVRERLPLNVAILPSDIPRVGIVTAPPNPPSDWTIRGRVDTSGPYHFFWPAGTYLTVTGQRGGMYRVRLAADRTAWVPAAEVRLLPAGAPPADAAVAAVRFSPRPEFIDLRIPLPARVPFQVSEEESALHIDVFGATSRINFFQYGRLDPLVAGAAWSQPADDVLRVSVNLNEPVWGYDTFYDASGALILRIRRPPVIDAAAPLRGMFIGVDAGHGGEDRSTRGPTDFREADANLQIALQLQQLLEGAGARVMMTRTTDMTVPLNDRPRMAADSGVHVLLSVHNNAFPDGVNPWANNGTSTYYYHPHSLDLARLIQRELLDELGLRDIGFGRADLALARPTWMPSVLSETAFMMIPAQEAALRDPAVQRRIAAAHVRALEEFLRSRAQR